MQSWRIILCRPTTANYKSENETYQFPIIYMYIYVYMTWLASWNFTLSGPNMNNPIASTACILFFHPLDLESEKKDFVLVCYWFMPMPLRILTAKLVYQSNRHREVNGLNLQTNLVIVLPYFMEQVKRGQSYSNRKVNMRFSYSSQWICLAMEDRPLWDRA